MFVRFGAGLLGMALRKIHDSSGTETREGSEACKRKLSFGRGGNRAYVHLQGPLNKYVVLLQRLRPDPVRPHQVLLPCLLTT